MPTNLPDQNWTIPAGPDLADNPLAFTDFAADVLQTVVLRYPNTATRDAFNGGRVAGDISFTTGNTWYDRWTGTKWIPATGIKAVSTSDQTVNNSTAFVNATSLVVPAPALNTFYALECFLMYDTSTTADIKFTFTAPAGAEVRFAGSGAATSVAAATGDGNYAATFTGLPLAFGGSGVSSFMAVHIYGTVSIVLTAGNIQLQFAQNSLDATNTRLNTRSWMRLDAIA